MKNLSKTLIAAATFACSALSHSAPVVVDQWSAAVTGVWQSFAPNPGVTVNSTNTLLSWGSNSVKSSLLVTSPAPSLVNTYIGGGVPPAAFTTPSVTLTHTNNPLPGGSSTLTGATLKVGVKLTPTIPNGPSFPELDLGDISYKIKFVETTNALPCDSVSVVPCNDIFVLLDGLLNQSFTYQDQLYFINAFPIDSVSGTLRTLTAAECQAAGAGSTCTGFTTPENDATSLRFGLSVSTERLAVPEPGSLALIGLAMTGLVAVRRRRAAAR